jgi:hypothetical protein
MRMAGPETSGPKLPVTAPVLEDSISMGIRTVSMVDASLQTTS